MGIEGGYRNPEVSPETKELGLQPREWQCLAEVIDDAAIRALGAGVVFEEALAMGEPKESRSDGSIRRPLQCGRSGQICWLNYTPDLTINGYLNY
jgi:hypothetical protein